jgi:hypothetical protein
VAVTLVAMLLASCGGQDPAPAQQSIAAVLDAFVTGTDVAQQCSRAVTPRFVRAVYGGSDACRHARSTMPGAGLAVTGSIRVSSTTAARVGGDHAAVTVTLAGSDGSGATGLVGLAHDDSGWRVDDLDDMLLRDLYRSRSLVIARRGARRAGQFARARGCVQSRVDRRSDRQIRAAYLPRSVNESTDAIVRLVRDVGACLLATGG